MKLKRYISTERLDEKVTKKEIEEALKSGDILVGAEFEFISEHLEDIYDRSTVADHQYNEADDKYDNYVEARDDWIDGEAGWYADMEDQIQDIRGQIEALEDDEDLLKQSKIWPEMELEEVERKLERLEEDLEQLISDQDNGVGRPEPPEVPYELVEYDNEYTDGYSNYDGVPPGEEIKRPEPPFGAYKDEEDSSYAEQLGTNRWWVVPDGTLGEAGIEVLSPPMPIPEFVKMVPKMFKWIGKEGYTNDKCGFHIHMSLKNVPDLKKEIDLVKLTMFTDEEYIFKSFKSRLNNQFVLSVKNKMMKSKSITKAEVKDLIDTKKLEQKVASSHYNAINWEGLSDDHGHIEYRYIGGKGYHKQWDKIKTITGQYAYNLNLACNKEFKKKEYFRKMFRVINKAEMKFLAWQLDTMEYVMTQSYKTEKDNKLLRKFIMTEYKRLANQYKNLEKLYGKPLKIGELSISDKTIFIKNLWSQIQKLNPSKEFANKYKVGLMGG
jgi:hypothetical protein